MEDAPSPAAPRACVAARRGAVRGLRGATIKNATVRKSKCDHRSRRTLTLRTVAFFSAGRLAQVRSALPQDRSKTPPRADAPRRRARRARRARARNAPASHAAPRPKRPRVSRRAAGQAGSTSATRRWCSCSAGARRPWAKRTQSPGWESLPRSIPASRLPIGRNVFGSLPPDVCIGCQRLKEPIAYPAGRQVSARRARARGVCVAQVLVGHRGAPPGAWRAAGVCARAVPRHHARPSRPGTPQGSAPPRPAPLRPAPGALGFVWEIRLQQGRQQHSKDKTATVHGRVSTQHTAHSTQHTALSAQCPTLNAQY